MNLIEITDFNGATQYVSAGAVEQITEAGASSQWHGIRSIVRLFNGKVIESQNTAYEVASMVKRAAQEPTPGVPRLCGGCAMTTDKPSPVAGPASEPAPLHHIINMRWAYEQACDLADWANANGTTLGNDEKLYQAAIKLRDTLGKATHAAQPVPAPAVDERTPDSGHLAAAPEQQLPEPVAFRYRYHTGGTWAFAKESSTYVPGPKFEQQALYTADQLRTAIAAERERNPWRMAIDDALVTAHLGVATDDPYDDLNLLLDWHHDIWLDPAVSSDAQALIDRGAAASEAELSTLRQQLAEAVRDVERMQFMEKDVYMLDAVSDPDSLVQVWVGPKQRLSTGRTVRAAIDAAIAAQGEAKPPGVERELFEGE